MENQPIQLDLIFPLYNPKTAWEKRLAEVIPDLLKYFDAINVSLNFILVDDGSAVTVFSSAVKQQLQEVARQQITFHHYAPNHGKGYCLRYGVARAQSDYQIYTDYDIPFGVESITSVYEALRNGADVVMGDRGAKYARHLSPFRKMLSTGVRGLNAIILGLPLNLVDAQGGIKGFNNVGKAAFLSTQIETFLFDTEFILLSFRGGLKIVKIPLTMRDDLHFSKMGMKILWRELKNMAKIFLRVRLFGAQINSENHHG